MECSNLGWVETIPGMKIVYSFFSLSQPSLAKKETRMMFFFLKKFFYYFFLNLFRNAPTKVGQKRYPEQIFLFLSFSTYHSLVWLEMMPE